MARYTGSPSYGPSAVTESKGLWIWSSKGLTIERSPTSLVVSSEARISPLSGFTARCRLRQVRRPRSPCFSACHSPAPHQPGRVHHDIDRAGVARQRRGQREISAPPGKRGVVGYFEADAEQGGDRAQQAFGLPPRLTKDEAQQMPRLDRQVGVRTG